MEMQSPKLASGTKQDSSVMTTQSMVNFPPNFVLLRHSSVQRAKLVYF